MSKADTWMPLYIGDYLADTMHLSGPEHGAYLLLLMHSWRTGPLPDDDRQLAAIARTELAAWRRMADTIRAFFAAENGALVQGRLERTRSEQGEKIEQRRAAGRASAAARNGQRNANERPTKTQRAFNERSTSVGASLPLSLEQTTRESESEAEKEERKKEDSPFATLTPSTAAPPRPRPPDDFEDWWSAYPRKVGKDAARRAYGAARKRGASQADLLMALHRQRWPDDPRYVPHPATWLNGGRWADDPEAAAPPERPKEAASKLGWMFDDMPDFNPPAPAQAYTLDAVAEPWEPVQ